MVRGNYRTIGYSFYAVIRRGERSKNWMGDEMAGKKLGPFQATRETNLNVQAGGRVFLLTDFDIEPLPVKGKT